MLILFSDTHLTDGSSGETINQEAFDLFADQVADLARKRQAAEVRLVLLGDGLDVIRSSFWLDHPGGIRPWSAAGPAQERLTLAILGAIFRRNRESLAHLRELGRRVSSRSCVPQGRVTFDYLLGNHDWLINRYTSTRAAVARELGLAGHYVSGRFPTEFTSPAGGYDCLARHGDIHDNLNFDATAGRDASSLGDSVVLELLHRLPYEVGRELGDHLAAPEVVTRLKEIDNVRPYPLISAWVSETVSRLGRGDPEVARAASRALARCIGDFLANPEFRRFADRQLTWLQRRYLRLLLNRIPRQRVTMVDSLVRLGERLLRSWAILRNRTDSEYAPYALAERLPDGRAPRFVVYGHTHEVESVPLGPAEQGGYDRIYLNSGTWRSVWQAADAACGGRYFASWKVMSYVVLYSAEEGQGRHEFELWTGQLRDRPLPAEMPEERAGQLAEALPAGGSRNDSTLIKSR